MDSSKLVNAIEKTTSATTSILEIYWREQHGTQVEFDEIKKSAFNKELLPEGYSVVITEIDNISKNNAIWLITQIINLCTSASEYAYLNKTETALRLLGHAVSLNAIIINIGASKPRENHLKTLSSIGGQAKSSKTRQVKEFAQKLALDRKPEGWRKKSEAIKDLLEEVFQENVRIGAGLSYDGFEVWLSRNIGSATFLKRNRKKTASD